MKLVWKVAAAVAALVVVAAVARATAPDRAAAMPAMKVLLENDCVRVQYHDVAVGEKTAMHSHPKYVVYVLNPYKARLTSEDGTQRISDRKAGEVMWYEPQSHSVENIGDTPIHNLVVELKPGGACH